MGVLSRREATLLKCRWKIDIVAVRERGGPFGSSVSIFVIRNPIREVQQSDIFSASENGRETVSLRKQTSFLTDGFVALK